MIQSMKTILRDLVDSTNRLLGRRDKTMPPRSLIRVSPNDTFDQAGQDWRKQLVEIGGLVPSDAVLEVGCGSGRVGRTLIDFFEEGGSYDGFDIREDEIRWLSKNITSDHSNIRFHYVDLYNKYYKPDGKIDPAEFVFPFEDSNFDMVYLTSIFTHLMPDDVNRYLAEIRRVLKPGGKCFISYFLINERSLGRIQEGNSSRKFAIEVVPHCFTDNEEVPEDATGYDETYILELYEKYGFTIDREIHYGRWSFDKQFNATVDYQDIIVASKPQ